MKIEVSEVRTAETRSTVGNALGGDRGGGKGRGWPKWSWRIKASLRGEKTG